MQLTSIASRQAGPAMGVCAAAFFLGITLLRAVHPQWVQEVEGNGAESWDLMAIDCGSQARLQVPFVASRSCGTCASQSASSVSSRWASAGRNATQPRIISLGRVAEPSCLTLPYIANMVARTQRQSERQKHEKKGN